MYLDAKNVQAESNKIIEAIKDYEMYQRNIEELIDISGFPVGAAIDLFSLSVVDKDFNNIKESGEYDSENNDLINLVKVTTRKIIKVQAICGSLTEGMFIIDDNECKSNITATNIHLGSLIGLLNIEQGKDKNIISLIDEINRLEKYIESNYFNNDWLLKIVSTEVLNDYITENLLSQIISGLKKLIENMEDGHSKLYYNTVIYHEVVEDVMAINLIKIVAKGTDTIETLYTGKCIGLVIEALINNKYEPYENISILKSIHTYGNIDQGHCLNPLTSSDIMWSHNVFSIKCDHMYCTHIIPINYTTPQVLNTTDNVKDAFDVGKMAEIQNIITKKKSVDLTKMKENQDELSSDKILISTDSYGLYTPDIISRRELRKVIIPIGKDLSNSFKAKYI